MKLLTLFLALIFIPPLASAAIEIRSQLNQEYNLGDDIQFAVSVVSDTSADALVKLTLKCTEKEIPYYISPISLEENKEIIISAPPIKAFSEGLCNILAVIESLEGGNLEGIRSKEFLVSNRLELSFDVDKTEALPGDRIIIKGTAKKHGGNVKEGRIDITLDDETESTELKAAEFRHELGLKENIKSGKHTLTIEVNDIYGNYQKGSKTINVQAVPSSLEFDISKKEIGPDEALKITVRLLDQAGETINKSIDIALFKEKSLFKKTAVIFNAQAQSNKESVFTLNHSTPADDYTLRSTFDDLEKEEIIKILPYPRIGMQVEGDSVLIRNVGNVRYDDYVTINLENENRTYIINKKIRLDVGEETAIGLAREVPSGTYTVNLPLEADPEGINKSKEIEVQKSPMYKRGIDMIVGGVIAGAGILINRPRMGLFVMILAILSIIGYFNRKKIKKIVGKAREKEREIL